MEEEAEILEEIQKKSTAEDIETEEVIAEEIPGTSGFIGGRNPFGNLRIIINGQDIFMN